MTRLLIIIICFVYSNCLSAQKIEEVYYGQFPTNTWNIPDTTTLIGHRVYDSIELRFKENRQFELSYKNLVSCPAMINERFGSGRFQVNGDTVYLKSKFKSEEFYTIEFIDTKSSNEDSLLIIICAESYRKTGCLLKGHRISIETNLGQIESIPIGDSILISKKANEIKISMDCPTSMDWLVSLSALENKGRIRINLLCNKNGESISLDSVKFLIKNDTLLMLDDFFFLEIKNHKFIKSNR